MKIFTGDRQTGKTTKLIELAAESEAKGEICYIVCTNHRQAYYVAQRAKEMGLNIGFPITFDEFLRGRSHISTNIHHLYIDDADQLIRTLAWGTPIAAISINVEKE